MEYASLNRQEAFNRAVTGLASQDFAKSVKGVGVDAVPSCQYRGPGGCRCAIGWCIPDEKYDVSLEGWRAGNHGVTMAMDEGLVENRGEILLSTDKTFVVELQKCHDHSRDAEDMKSRLAGFAKLYGLSVPADLR